MSPSSSRFPQFKYEPLPSPTSIRLLRRVTSRIGNTFFGHTAFELHTFELDDTPAFEALSYTWGNPNSPASKAYYQAFDRNEHFVILNGAWLYVRPNLYNALRCLCQRKFINATDPDNGNKSLLHTAVDKGDVREVRGLLRAGADVAVTASDGPPTYRQFTPLELACQRGHVEVVKELTKPEYLSQYLRHLQKIQVGGHDARKIQNYIADLVEHKLEYDGWWWVDAICINQEDLEERASQVRLMARIYSVARHVPVWLGNGWGRTRSDRFLANLDLKDLLKGNETSISEDYMDAAIEFFDRTWFSRTWVIQEALQAKLVTFWIDGYMTSYREFEQILEKISHMSYPTTSSASEIRNFNRAIRKGRNLQSLRNRFRNLQDEEFPLYGLLAQSGSYECTEPLDRIYSLFSLVRDQSGRPEIPMDISYTAPLHEIFTFATRHALMEVQNLSLLSWASSAWFGDEKMATGLPSWVPAYHLFQTVRGPEMCLEGIPGISAAVNTVLAQRRQFAASRRWRQDRNEQAFAGNVTGYSPELEINGLRIDRVVQVEETEPKLQIRFRRSWLRLVASFSNKTYPNGDSLAKALMITALAGRYSPSSVFRPTTSQATWDDAKQFWGDLMRTSITLDRTEAAATLRELLSAEDSQTLDTLETADGQGFLLNSKQIDTYDIQARSKSENYRGPLAEDIRQTLVECLTNALDRRVMFVTERGYLGLGPVGTQIGDEIWVLPASTVPFLFRAIEEEEGRYNLVGETYVHGIMFGEAVSGDDAKLTSTILT